jgi:sporulation protein YlmC with PRC-barrel domain
MAECRKDAFKSIQEAAVTPAPDSNSAAKTSSDVAAEGSTSATQPATSTDQAAASTTTSAEQTTTTATVEQPAASTTTATTDPAATAEQPAASTDQAATAEQPAASTDQAATAEQPAASTGQVATDQAATPAHQPSGDMLASKLIGTTVVSIDNQNIGEINDIVIDVENQEAAQAIIGVGGFLGIGEKNVAVELNRLNVRTDANSNSWTVVLDTTEDELKQMPEYKAAAN